METKILIVGAGRVGCALDKILRIHGLQAHLSDRLEGVSKKEKYTDIFACVPYVGIQEVAEYAASMEANFFDFTEHAEVKNIVREIYMKVFKAYGNFKAAVVNGCGVAPGICNIIAGSLMRQMHRVDSVSMCVGGIPQNKDINSLHYYSTWNLLGLWNLYFKNPVTYRWEGKEATGKLGVGLRRINIFGEEYEAFLTGGTMVDSILEDTGIKSVSYSTIRHVSHLDKMLTLDSLLNFRHNPDLFCHIMDQLPHKDKEDKVILSVEVAGITKDLSEQKLIHEVVYKPTYNLETMSFCTALGGYTAFKNVKERKLVGYIKQEDLKLLC